MALQFKRVKRAFGFDESRTEKYFVTPDRALPVEFEYLCEVIAMASGFSMGVVRAVVYDLVRSMKTFIQQGHTVQVEGLGSFIPSFNAKSSTEEEEANADSIYRTKLRFVPCMELREMMEKLELVCSDKSNVPSSGTDSSEEEEERPGGL